MSWFDRSGFANLAKSALKEAQKTIDKALDIQEEDSEVSQDSVDNGADFFVSWGLQGIQENNEKEKPSTHKQPAASIWGSFTGSFFDSSKLEDEKLSETIKCSKSLEELSNESCQKLKVMLSVSENVVCQSISESMLENVLQFEDDDKVNADEQDTTEKHDLSKTSMDIEKEGTNGKWKRINKTETPESISENSSKLNILHAPDTVSVVSVENNGKSFESSEVLDVKSNRSANYINTLKSNINSASPALSSSAINLKENLESVTTLPNDLLSCSDSIEMFDNWKRDGNQFSCPIDQKKFDVSPTVEKYELNSTSVIGSNYLPSSISKEQSVASCSYISPYESSSDEIKMSYSGPMYVDSNTPSSSVLSSFATEKDSTKGDSNDILPENMKVVSNINEPDEISLAKGSHSSTSEITTMTIIEHFQQLDPVKIKLEIPDKDLKIHDSCFDSKQISISNLESQLNLSQNSQKEKHNLHLSAEPITMQPICKVENFEIVGKAADMDLFEELKYSNVERQNSNLFHENEQWDLKIDTIEARDQYLILTDSSCEGTLIESSSDDNAVLISKTESKIVETALTASSYMKNMLADAMDEKGDTLDLEKHCTEVPCENLSTISSESRSDLVKIGSDQNSGHTSSDELETTTSSDIEVLSRYSPNGDSSSAQSRQSPIKLQQLNKSSNILTKTSGKVRGHSREYSNISIGSDETNLEIEQLLKRIQEITEILEARESKLISVSRMNMELHEQNNNLKKQLDSIEKHAEQNQDLTQITNEFTQQLSSSEKKFQQAIKERDMSRKQLDQLKQEVAARLSSQEACAINVEKDKIIRELQEEGEKLSKQQLKHSNIIKKLQAKEKENVEIMKNQKQQYEEECLKSERLKRSLQAKEDVERTQIDAVHTLTAKLMQQEKQLSNLQENLDNALCKMDTYKKNFNVAKKELIETKKRLTVTEEELKEMADSARESCQLMMQVQDLKSKLQQATEVHVKREESLKQENAELLKRLEFAEVKCEEFSESVSIATKPLSRQLEQLQTNLAHKSNSFMKQEKIMSEKIIELETRIEALIETNNSLKEQNTNLKSKISDLESKIYSKELEKIKLVGLHEQMRLESKELADENQTQSQMIEMLKQFYSDQIKELKQENNTLKNKLSIKMAATIDEEGKTLETLEHQKSMDDSKHDPTLSIRRDSLNCWNDVWSAFTDSKFDISSGKFSNMYENIRIRSSSTSMFENLQAQLKLRDGEIQHLQWELSRRNTEKDILNSELSALVLKVEDLNNKVSEIEILKGNLTDIQTKYDALLQMYGEKVEENQELQLDLEDVTEMYKSQIIQLLRRNV